MYRLFFTLFFLTFAGTTYAAWEWRDRSAEQWALRQPLIHYNLPDTGYFKVIATLGRPFNLPDVTTGHIRFRGQDSLHVVHLELSQLGTNGYTETAFLGMGGMHKRWWYAMLGVRIGSVYVPPLARRYRVTAVAEGGVRYRDIFAILRHEQSLRGFNDPVNLPYQTQLSSQYRYNEQLNLYAGYEHRNRDDDECGFGIAWTPLKEITLRYGIDPQRGWGAGISLKVRQFTLSFASFEQAPAGWSQLWSLQVESLAPPQPGWLYPP